MGILKNRIPKEVAGTVLLLQVPRTNDKKELAAEQMFAALHGLLCDPTEGFLKIQRHERVSFEIAVQKKQIGFYVWVPNHLTNFVEEQIYAQYPLVNISQVPDYTLDNPSSGSVLATSLKFVANQALPIKTFPNFEVDPLASITATLAQFGENEEAWLQFIATPASSNWHKQSERYAADRRNNGGGLVAGGLANALWTAPNAQNPHKSQIAEYEQARAAGAETKSQKLAYNLTVRIICRGQNSFEETRLRLQAITASFKQFNTTYLNGFSAQTPTKDPREILAYRQRATQRRSLLCNIEEIASLYHLPHTNVETPNILWANAKTAEPPANLSLITDENRDQVSPVAVTDFRGHHSLFGISRHDRGRHLYVIGQTGVGKSGFLELLTLADIASPYGFAVIDPHGDYANNILKRIPVNRVQDVVYFNPADTAFPIAFNPMEVLDEKLKTHTASELIGVLKRMFDSWGPRLEYILRYSLLALLDYPNATMMDITRILTDKKFRDEVLEHVDDPVVRNFWQIEFASWNDKFVAEAVAPVLNKIGAFTANPIVRNIIGQPKSSFNIRKIMDERKILIVNLSRGLIGEDNAALLGALLVTKIQMSAMSRADTPQEKRVPFYLYVDEFQNFATDSFATILSEARKYGLNLTVANQYIGQMSPDVRDAVFGNVGSIVAFRTGADDARVLQKYFEPQFEDQDIIHLHNRNFTMSMIIEGEKAMAFSGSTIELPAFGDDYSLALIEYSRRHYTVGRGYIETFMQDRYTTTQPPLKQPLAQTNPARTPADLALRNSAYKPKRKRSSLRRKPKNITSVSQTKQTPTETETILYLR